MKKENNTIPKYIGENIALCACANWKYYNIPDEFKKWCINLMFNVMKPDLLFDMHPWDNTSRDYPVPIYYETLKNNTYLFPIVKPSFDENLKHQNQLIYPDNEIIEKYGMNLKNSIPQMICYAVWCNWKYDNKIKNLYLYGVSTSEFKKYPEMGFSFYEAVGFAKGNGIKVYFLSTYLMDEDDDIYGYYKLTKKRIKE